ncbi:putative transcription factor CG1-CAMTA family [Medicago truncatula]|uniref:Calmodulin-binding transcription activator 1 n=1 Tax=Medicago truncatula TaxID=3880 RepID=A0A072UQ84_MEDTR|nr:calmodulin-binding transcription activator 2 isoform X2 [Medicago truncatula]KEH31218.1 calmodulin-binding transcription activator 1 [Medicago truncatula]RHN62714.1 putative transcription factor CG1-CAMTA family [Medicago truncatula]
MTERSSPEMALRLDFKQLQFEAQHRWLRPAEILGILSNYQMFEISKEPPTRPPSGSLFLFNRKILRHFRRDGYNWRKKNDGKTVKEAHEKLKVEGSDKIHCYYAHGEDNENFQRRSYWRLEPDMMDIVFVHYLDVKVNKSNVGISTDTKEVTSDSQKGSSTSSGFPANYGNMRSRNMDSMSPTSTLTSLCEDADSEDIHQASSVFRTFHELHNPGNGPQTDKIGAHSNGPNLMHPFSGSNYLPLVQGGKFNSNEGQRALDIGSWDNVMDKSSGTHTDPSPVSSYSFPSSSMSVFNEGSGSQSLQSNWQNPFEENAGGFPKWSFTQSLSMEFESNYSAELLGLGKETGYASPEIDPDLFSFDFEPKEQSVHQNLHTEHASMNAKESLTKVDSFSKWIKEFASVDDLHMQSSPDISWGTDECGNVIDDTSLDLSLSQDQLFSIHDFSPKWAYADSEIEVLIIGTFVNSRPEVTTCNWSCMFGEVEVPATILANGILSCQAPPHEIGRVPFYVTFSNRFACSEVQEFEYKEGFTRNVDLADFFNNSTEMRHHLHLEELLTLDSVHLSDQVLEVDMEKSNMIHKLISLKEKDEYSCNEEPTGEMDISKHRLKAHIFHRQVKEKLYSWLLHKVTETGKGPHVFGKDGQGVLHLVAALGYDWAIAPIVTSGVNINFRDVNGWTALHWAASCGRERTVALLVSMGAAAGALTDPCPAFPSGRTPADLASGDGQKGISGFLAESLLTSHLESLTMDDVNKDGTKETLGMKAVQTISERIATPVHWGDMQDAICLKDSLDAVRNATQAADRIHQVFRMQSFQRKQLAQYEEDGEEFGLSDQQALSLLASKASKSGHGEGSANAAAVQIQKKFRGWTKRKEFLFIRQRVVKIQAHVRGHQVRKKYKPIIWSVGILEKVILRWRRKGSGLRGFRSDAINKVPNQPTSLPEKEDDYDFLKEGRKQSEQKFQKALLRVKSMVQYPEARAQYRRLLNVVDDYRQTKTCNLSSISSEEAADGVEDLVDIQMLFNDDNFVPMSFD